MSQKLNAAIAVIGIDIGKNSSLRGPQRWMQAKARCHSPVRQLSNAQTFDTASVNSSPADKFEQG